MQRILNAVRDPANRFIVIFGLVFWPILPILVLMLCGAHFQATIYLGLVHVNMAVLLIAIARYMRSRGEISFVAILASYCIVAALICYATPSALIATYSH